MESISKLINESKYVDICVAKTEKVHNLCGVFSSSISESINTMIESDIHKIGYLLKNNNTKMIEFLNDDEFMNINNKEDYSNSLSFISKNNNSNK